MNVWQFLIQLNREHPIVLYFALGVVLVAVFQIVRGDWKIVRTKEGRMAFTTSAQRSLYDVSKSAAKALDRRLDRTELLIRDLAAGRAQNADAITSIAAKLDDMAKDGKDLNLEVSKWFLHDETMPYQERVYNAHRYIRLGGNHTTRFYIKDTLRGKNAEEFDAAWQEADEIRGKVML